MVELELNGKKVTAPIWIQAGHPDNSVTVFLGYGRRRAGRAGTGAGFDMYPLRYSATPWFADGREDHKGWRNLQARIHSGLPDHGHSQWCHAPAGARNHA